MSLFMSKSLDISKYMYDYLQDIIDAMVEVYGDELENWVFIDYTDIIGPGPQITFLCRFDNLNLQTESLDYGKILNLLNDINLAIFPFCIGFVFLSSQDYGKGLYFFE